VTDSAAPKVKRVVVVGGGLAGAKTAEALRAEGYRGAITLVGAESELPYERPPLSKGYLLGSADFDEAVVHPKDWYADNDVELRLGTRAIALDVRRKLLSLADGASLDYDRLVLATGSTPRRLTLAGADAENVLYLREHADSDAIRATFGEGRRLVVIGAGWIGLEVAAAAREAGTAVDVVETAELPLLAIVGRAVAGVFADLHRAHGVNFHFGAQVERIDALNGRANAVVLADGTRLEADAVVVGIGVLPNVELARAAGLDVENGVLVDASLRTTAPDVFAVGDIAAHEHPVLGRRVRVEHWAAALNQPATVAKAITGGDARYEDLPYFFSDQYDLGMEYIGLADPQARVVIRGDLDGREFVAFWLDDDDAVTAAMNVNVWDVLDGIKPLILARTPVDVARLADPDVPYDAVAR
jgi:NADPH-dependent 2,4-dienoyl-CoA reductase/sulfur reductase-like enzyme